jgi:hypothetical protein
MFWAMLVWLFVCGFVSVGFFFAFLCVFKNKYGGGHLFHPMMSSLEQR